MDSKGLSESEHYGSFVDRTLAHVIAGLQTDGATKKQKIADGLKTPVGAAPHERVRDARFALGADDASYLQSGLAMLWTTAADGGENELALAPAGLYAPDAVGGVRAGSCAGFASSTKDMHANAPKRLQTLAPAILGLLDTPYVSKKGTNLADAVDVPGLQEALKKVANIKNIKDNEDVFEKDSRSCSSSSTAPRGRRSPTRWSRASSPKWSRRAETRWSRQRRNASKSWRRYKSSFPTWKANLTHRVWSSSRPKRRFLRKKKRWNNWKRARYCFNLCARRCLKNCNASNGNPKRMRQRRQTAARRRRCRKRSGR